MDTPRGSGQAKPTRPHHFQVFPHLRLNMICEEKTPLPCEVVTNVSIVGCTVASDASIQHMTRFIPKNTDVIIATPPKTGTTVLQQICHQLRTGGDMSFEDIHQVSPYMPQAYDMGIDLNAEQITEPRLFKAHSPLSCLPAGCKKIIAVRDPCQMVLSAFNYYRLKFDHIDSVGVVKFAEKYIGPEFFNIMYEGFLHRHDSNVLLVAYEDLLDQKQKPATIERIAKFIGIELTPSLLQTTLDLSSKAAMLNHVSKFDNSWSMRQIAIRGGGTNRVGTNVARAAAKVTDRPKGVLQEDAAKFVSQLWYDIIGRKVDIPSYEMMLQVLRLEQE